MELFMSLYSVRNAVVHPCKTFPMCLLRSVGQSTNLKMRFFLKNLMCNRVHLQNLQLYCLLYSQAMRIIDKKAYHVPSGSCLKISRTCTSYGILCHFCSSQLRLVDLIVQFDVGMNKWVYRYWHLVILWNENNALGLLKVAYDTWNWKWNMYLYNSKISENQQHQKLHKIDSWLFILL